MKKYFIIPFILPFYAHANYISGDNIPSAIDILPKPPALGSLAFKNDIDGFESIRKNKSLKTSDAVKATDLYDLSYLYSDSVGVEISEKNTPNTYHLLKDMVLLGAANKSVMQIKGYYGRVRPFVYFHQSQCTPEFTKQLEDKGNGSYPSGHAIAGWLTALVLSSALPQRGAYILARGQEIGDLRVKCGVHWPSDVAAGRLYASALFSALQQSVEFNSLISKVKLELNEKYKQRDAESNLYAPTYVKYLDGKWFIVDCWQSRILWSKTFYRDLKKWKVMADGFSSHSIAFDPGNKIFAVEDTENGAENFYSFDGVGFHRVARLSNLGRRTHKTIFDEKTKEFIILAATTGEVFRVSYNNGNPKITNKYTLPFKDKKNNSYEIRSFAIHNGLIYFVSSMADKNIIVAKDDKQLSFVRKIPVPDDLSNMQDITFSPDGHVFITADYKKFAILKNVNEISKASNQYDKYPFKGSPYWITFYKGKIIIPEIGYFTADDANFALNGVSLWNLSKGKLTKERELIDYNSPSLASEKLKKAIVFQIY